MRPVFTVVCLLLALPQTSPVLRLTFAAQSPAYAVLRLRVDDAASTAAAAVVDVIVDGRRAQSVVLTPGTKRSSYAALLGPLTAGSHDVRLEPSSLWDWDASLRLAEATVEVIPVSDKRFETFANAPAIGLRSDTIGTASDLPLMMYVEDVSDGAARWLKYSVVFSHEDGGTPGAALMARWGRTTDIELAYEVELRGGSAVQARYQGPDHRVFQKEHLDVRPPLLLVSTLNNMFLDRGHAAAIVRMVPELVDLSERSRESVMDERPWIYRVMARELARERPEGVGDPRDYVYVDLRLASRNAGIALGARFPGGITRWSDRGRPELVVSRQGELRIAIPASAREEIQAIAVRCDPRPDTGGSAERARCDVSIRKVFRLDTAHDPQPSLASATQLSIDGGSARDVALNRQAPPR